ncbi:2Fe-2S iron-sulfur cluster-binding protein [Streptomyces sp. NPDC058171]
MTDRHGGAGGWEPIPRGEHDPEAGADATAFVRLPEGFDLHAHSPLAAPGHGYVPPRITASPTTGQPVDPTAPPAGTWAPQGAAGPARTVGWPEPAASGGHAQHPPRHTDVPHGPAGAGGEHAFEAGRTAPGRSGYDPGETAQWTFPDVVPPEGSAPGGPGHEPTQDGTGQWTIPLAASDLPDESGEFTTSTLASQWGATAPATLPGGAPAPWATDPGPDWTAPAADHGTPAHGTGQHGTAQHGTPAHGTPAHGTDTAHPADAPTGPQDPGGYPTGAHPPAAEHPVRGEGDTGPAPAPDGAARTPAPPGAPEAAQDGPGAPVPVPAAQDAPEHPADAPAATTPDHVREDSTAADPADGTDPAGRTAADEPAAPPETAPPGHVEHDAAADDDPAAPAPAAAEETLVHHDEHPLISYTLRVNGVDRPVTEAWIGESLLYVLRERLGLAGAKDGCSQGECGACNIQVDGRLVASCLVPAATTAGSEIRTVEGLAADGRPSDVQRALARCGAVQCGFCVPGMAMTVHDLLEGNPAPTEREARQALCGNLCRCSGYRGVLEAVREVVEEREAHAAAVAPPATPDPADTGEAPPHLGGPGEPRIPHQAGPGAGGVHPHAHDPYGPYGQGGGQA